MNGNRSHRFSRTFVKSPTKLGPSFLYQPEPACPIMLNGFGAPTKLSPAVFLSIKKSGRRKGLPPAKLIFFFRKHVVLFPDPHSIREDLLCARANRVPQGKRILYPFPLVAAAMASIHGPFRLAHMRDVWRKKYPIGREPRTVFKGAPHFRRTSLAGMENFKKKAAPPRQTGNRDFLPMKLIKAASFPCPVSGLAGAPVNRTGTGRDSGWKNLGNRRSMFL